MKEIIKRLVIKIMIYKNDLLYHLKKKSKKTSNNKEKRILVFISRLHTGGAEKAAIHIAEELSEKYPVQILIYSDREDYEYACEVPVIEAKEYKKSRFQLFSLIKEVKKIKKENQITHTISFCTKANFVNVASREEDKTIISVRNYLSNSKENNTYKMYNKIACKLADKIVSVSTLVKDDLVKNYEAERDKIQTIYNFIEEKKIEDQLKEITPEIERLENNDPVILSIGRLSYQKAQWHLIKAFQIVKNKIPNAKLVILGKGELEEKLKELVKKLNLQDNVFLLGFQKNPYQYMKASEIFILTSYYEGMSNAILEAMVCGLPVIATDCKAGNREILAPNTEINFETRVMKKEEYGIIVPVCYEESKQITFEEKEMAKAMIELLENEDLRIHYRKKSKERVHAFTKEKSMEKWIKIIESI